MVVTGQLAIPEAAGKRPAALLMDSPATTGAGAGVPPSSGSNGASGRLIGEVERLAKSGVLVLAIDPRPSPPGTESISRHLGPFNLLSLRAFLVGGTLVGLRVDDVVRAVDWLRARPDVGTITVHGVGPHGIVALHAAVLDRRIERLVLENTLTSYRAIVDQPDSPRGVRGGDSGGAAALRHRRSAAGDVSAAGPDHRAGRRARGAVLRARRRPPLSSACGRWSRKPGWGAVSAWCGRRQGVRSGSGIGIGSCALCTVHSALIPDPRSPDPRSPIPDPNPGSRCPVYWRGLEPVAPLPLGESSLQVAERVLDAGQDVLEHLRVVVVDRLVMAERLVEHAALAFAPDPAQSRNRGRCAGGFPSLVARRSSASSRCWSGRGRCRATRSPG